jgi:hypothetical protein
MAMAILSPASATGFSIIPLDTTRLVLIRRFFLSGNITSKWQIIQPLLLTEERDDDGSYLISDDLFEVYGDGSTVPDAIEDYITSLIDYYEILSVSSQENDELVKAQFHRLQRYLRPVREE